MCRDDGASLPVGPGSGVCATVVFYAAVRVVGAIGPRVIDGRGVVESHRGGLGRDRLFMGWVLRLSGQGMVTADAHRVL